MRELLDKQSIRSDRHEQDENGQWQHASQIAERLVSFITTTTGSMHNEDETCVIAFCTDSGAEQTQRVMIRESKDADYAELADDVGARWLAHSDWLALRAKTVAAAYILSVVHPHLDASCKRIRCDV